MKDLTELRKTTDEFLNAALSYSFGAIGPTDDAYWERVHRYDAATESFRYEIKKWDTEINRHLSTLMDEWELVIAANLVRQIMEEMECVQIKTPN